MIQNYFIYNGEKYPSGTIIKINSMGTKIEDAVFLYYKTDINKYFVQVGSCTHICPKKLFDAILVEVTDKINTNVLNNYRYPTETRNVSRTFKDELEIDGMLNAWIWYVVIMLVATIFNDRIGIWIFASIVFFTYRRKKLK